MSDVDAGTEGTNQAVELHSSALVLCAENALAQLQPEASQVLLSPRCHCDGALQ